VTSLGRLAVAALLASCLQGCEASPPAQPSSSAAPAPAAPADPLPSWNAVPSRTAITGFVDRVTREGGSDFVPPAERIAVFDNDGTLWSEQPMYFQLQFALDRVRALAPQHPEWKTTQPFKAVIDGDVKALMAQGEKGLLEIVAVAHSGLTIEEFSGIVREWAGSARHPKTNRLYTEMIYQPMLEVLNYLRANGFKTFIVSGGGVEFMRPWVEQTYGIPPEQVVGSRGKLKYEVRDGKGQLLKLPAVDLIDDKAGKPVGIAQVIGRRPIIAFGNSDGDFEMLEYTTTGPGARLGVIVHHTDADREWAYDRTSHIGQLLRGLDEAPKRGWILVDMRQDWKTIYPHAR
jgi:phosphoglycolate phosphatase-like HAD superfamily hydrolase